ncbi:MAG TPA: HEAT repeat domain-containing protein, partial [Chloroflexota bacterium]|nr:HEAT repeat domain-containing protein [Chloroflexota bacterium]
FTAATAAAVLLTRVLLVGPLLTRYGVRVQLLLTPLSVGLGTLAVVVTGSVFGPVPALFWFGSLTKVFMEINWDSIYGPAKLILLQPLPPRKRTWLQTVVEAMGEPLAQGVAGVILLVVVAVAPFDAIHLSYVTVPVLIAYTVLALLVGRAYVGGLLQAVAKRLLGSETVPLNDSATLAVLEKGISSNEPAQVLYCIGALEDGRHPRLASFLADLVRHPAPEVREDALQRIERLRVAGALRAAQAQLEVEQHPAVRAAAIRALCVLDPDESDEVIDRVVAALDDPEPRVRFAAMVGLLRHGGIEGVTSAGEWLRRLVVSEASEDRAFGAEVIGEVAMRSFYRPLRALLADPSMNVRQAALIAAGRLKNPRIWPLVLENLHGTAASGAAMRALVEAGEDIVPFLDETMKRAEIEEALRLQVLKACGRMAGTRVMDILKRDLLFPDTDVRHQVLRSLTARGYRATAEDAGTVNQLITLEASICTWGLAARRDLLSAVGSQSVPQADHLDDGNQVEGLPRHLLTALTGEVDQARERLFLLLALIYNATTIMRSLAHHASESPEKRAYALELLDTALSQEHKLVVLPLVDTLEVDECLARLASRLPQSRLSPVERLKDIAGRPPEALSAWTRACALHAMGITTSMEFPEAVVNNLGATDPLIRETAIWALGQLQPDDLVRRLQPLTEDHVPTVSAMANTILAGALSGAS